VPSRRLDDHIRELCGKVIASRTTDYKPAIEELKAALREHTRRLRKLAAEQMSEISPSAKDRRRP